MLELIEWTGSVGVREFWVPVLVWTSLAGVVVLGLRARAGRLLPAFSGTRLHPLAGYRLRQALLLALPASVLAAPWMPAVWGLETELPRPARFTAPGPPMAPPAPGEVPLAPDQAHAVETAATLFGAATVVIALLAIMRLTALAVDLRRLRTIRRAAPVVEDPMPQRLLSELAVRLGVRRPVNLLEGPPDSAPMTFGFRRPVVVVPRTALDSPGSLGTVLAHELIHIRRGDYCWALLESFTCAVFAFHPLARLLHRGIERCRETSCDAEVVGAGLVRPREYAELLAHTHTPARFPTPAVAARMSARAVTLKERLETMKYFADVGLTVRWRVGVAAGAGVLFTLIATIAACSGKPSGESAAPDEPGSLSIDQPSQSFLIPLSIGPEGPVQYTRATEEEVEEELARLETQVQYLRERMQHLGDREEEAIRAWEDLDDNARQASSRELQDLRLRRDLLGDMRKEAVRRHETVKLVYETQKRTRDRR